MKATFVGLPAFDRFRASHLSDDEFAGLQLTMIETELMARSRDG